MIKKVIYENAFGQKIVFDNKIFFCESIDTTGGKGVHAAETLAFADGQKTISHQLGAKTIPCSFAFKDIYDDDYEKDRIKSVFNPLVSGLLTVYNKYGKYTAEVYPQDLPSIEKDRKVPYVYRWNVDFIADYPYWKGKRHFQNLIRSSGTENIVNCKSDTYTPPIIVFGGTQTQTNQGYTIVQDSHGGFSIKPYPKDVTIECLSMKLTDSDGNNVNYLIDASADLSALTLSPGQNIIRVIASPSDGSAAIGYDELLTGVI